MQKRKLKVYATMREHKVNYQTWYRKVPTILLSGDWLTACGFDPADEISVSASLLKLVSRELSATYRR